MKALRRIFERPGRKLILLTSVAVLLISAGCEDDILEMEGDQKPKQAEFRVTLPLRSISVSLTPGESGIIRIPVQFSAACFGPTPSACVPEDPAWHWDFDSSFHDYPTWQVQLVNPQNLDVPGANIFLDVAAYLAKHTSQASSLVGNEDKQWIEFHPTSLPKGMTLTGSRRFDIGISLSAPGGERKEAPIGEAHLTPIFPPSPMEQYKNYRVGVTYTGAANSLGMSKTGQDAALFSVNNIFPNTGPPFSVSDGSTVEVLVTFLGAADSQIHTATLAFTPENGGKTVPIVLQGRQQ